MDDIISRQAAIDNLERYRELFSWDDGDRERAILSRVIKELQSMPTAEPRKGKWEEKQDNDWAGGGAWVCSECGCGYAFGAYHEALEFNYCPNCGARMEE